MGDLNNYSDHTRGGEVVNGEMMCTSLAQQSARSRQPKEPRSQARLMEQSSGLRSALRFMALVALFPVPTSGLATIGITKVTSSPPWLSNAMPSPHLSALRERSSAPFMASKPVWNPVRLAKLSVFAAATGCSLAYGGSPSRAILAKAFSGSLACTMPGLLDAHLAVSYGYGASLAWQAACFAPLISSGTPARLLLWCYAAYGLKVCIFQAARDCTPAYVAKALAPRRAQAKHKGIGAKLPSSFALAALLTLFSFPLHGAAAATSGRAALGVRIGAGVAASGLLLQTIADVQKYAHKATAGADSFCTSGLWAWSRHPNYLGEIVFHIGLLLAAWSGCAASTSAAVVTTGWLAFLAPATFVSIMLGSTRGLEARQRAEYADEPRYRDYVSRTPRLLFGRSPRADAEWAAAYEPAASPSWEGEAAAEAVSDKFSPEEISRMVYEGSEAASVPLVLDDDDDDVEWVQL